MKICYVSSVFPRSDADFEVPWLRILVKELRKKGHDITIFAPAFRGLKSHTVEGIPVHRFRYFLAPWETLTHDEGAPNKIHKLHYKIITLFYILCGILDLIRIHAKNRFDILHVHWPIPHGLFAVIAQKFVPAKIVLTYYGADLLMAKKFSFVKHFITYFTKHADRVIAISNFTGNEVTKIYNRKLDIVPYGTTFTPKTVTHEHSPGFKIITVGRLIWRKGFTFLIDAMPYVLKKYPEAECAIIGGGMLIDDLKKQRDDLGLQESIEITGKIPNEELEKRYAGCDLFVLPSIVDHKGDTEGLGVVIIEALVYGKPVIATDVGGIGDIVIHEKTGLLVEQKNPQALANAIIRTFENRAEANGFAAEGLRHVTNTFDWPVVVHKVENIYTSLCPQNLTN